MGRGSHFSKLRAHKTTSPNLRLEPPQLACKNHGAGRLGLAIVFSVAPPSQACRVPQYYIGILRMAGCWGRMMRRNIA